MEVINDTGIPRNSSDGARAPLSCLKWGATREGPLLSYLVFEDNLAIFGGTTRELQETWSAESIAQTRCYKQSSTRVITAA